MIMLLNCKRNFTLRDTTTPRVSAAITKIICEAGHRGADGNDIRKDLP